MRIRWWREGVWGAGLLLSCALTGLAGAQLSGASSTPNAATTSTNSTASTTVVVRTLLGQVVNALDGAPVSRVLVTINGRSVMTDSQGRYEFPGFADSSATVKLLKPGFSDAPDQSVTSGGRKLTDLDATARLKLYPDAIITGAVTGRDGLPLTGIPVMLRRASYNATGLTWTAARSAQTDLHGEYRFREPAGRFQLTASYVPHSKDTGEAVLPVSFPGNSGSADSSFFEVSAGEEKHVDLRARSGPAYAISVRMDPVDAQRGAQFYASTDAGDAFVLQPGGGWMGPGAGSGMGSGNSGTGSGTVQIALPAGSYTLQARMESRDSSLDGLTKLTVTGPRMDPVVIHLQPAASLPVEVALDPNAATNASTSSGSTLPASVTVPDARQFTLHLHNDAASILNGQDIALRQADNKGYEFRVPPGRYRLQEGTNAGWYVESATYGTSDLMRDEIAISSGGSGLPIRLIVSNAFGMVNGTVKFPENSNDPVDLLYVYLIPTTPSLAAINPVSVSNPGTTTGTFSTRLPAGSYLALAVDHRLQQDLRDPDVQAQFSTAARPFTVSTSATASVELDVMQVKEPGK